ncbi:MAG: SDR family NAD(P)-dependent oxidoreductase [Betaproteobacteria bacterium]|nr:SDR family NAD(P)-dependent oxidoreductase [Betaproteobacteria bacterium]
MNAAAIASPEDHCLEGQAVVITGAARGLGAAYARLAAAEGARVVVNDIDAAGAEAVAAQICSAGGEACASGANIARWDHAAALVQLCVDRYGAIDGLVNNAALFRMARPEEEEAEAVRALIEVNVLGTLHCGVHALRHMLLRRRGSIVNITSGAQAGSSLQGAYGASKGAVASLTYSWALDCAASGVRVNAFAPMRLDGGRLSLMTHPAVLHPPLEREHWSIAELQAAWSSHFAQRQLPLGVVAAEWSERAYALPYRRAAEGSGPRSDGERKPHA